MESTPVKIPRKTNRQRVLELLQDHQWHSTMDIVRVGGFQGCRRIWELRDEGYQIRCERIPGSDLWRYRLERWHA